MKLNRQATLGAIHFPMNLESSGSVSKLGEFIVNFFFHNFWEINKIYQQLFGVMKDNWQNLMALKDRIF